MSSTVDSYITTMKLDNKQFEAGAKTSLATLDSLKKAMDFSTASKGMQDLQGVANRFSLSSMMQAPAAVGAAFVAMSTIAITAISNITTHALQAGANLVKSLTIAPITAGLDEYETNLNSIQTILANTGLEGQKGLDKVNKALNQLNHYSDKTIYNFSEMARNIGTFTAAGVDLDTSTAAIKGIANLAAVSGSNAQQASTAMYQLSQALAAGKLTLMDWNSVVNAGMGGKVFQESLKETARVNGVAIDEIIAQHGSFRESLQEGWITSDILTETLSKFTGDLNAQQLKTMGYNEQQIKDILKMGKTATDAATKVKTMSQLIGTLQETVGSGWAKTWSLLLGDFGEAKELFTGINDAIGGMLGRQADARNKVLKDWKKLGGRTELIKALTNVWDALLSILDPIRDAFRDIFPAKTGKQLYDLTVALREFTEGLSISRGTAEDLKSTFRGIFAVFSIGYQIIKGVLKYFFSLFGLIGEGSGGVLNLTGSIGDLLFSLDQWLKKGDKIGSFFDGLIAARKAALEPIIKVIGGIIGAMGDLITSGPEAFAESISKSFGEIGPVMEQVGDAIGDAVQTIGDEVQWLGDILAPVGELFSNVFNGFTSGAEDASSSLEGVGESLTPLQKILSGIETVWDGLVNAWSAVSEFLAPVGAALGVAFGWLKDRIGTFLQDMGLEDALAVVNTGFFIAMYLAFRKFISSMGSLADSAAGAWSGLDKTFGQVTKNLQAMQAEVRSKVILNIALALLVMAGALWILSKVPADSLTKSMVAVTTMIAVLVGSLKALEAGATWNGAAQMAILSAAMIGLAIGLTALSGAVVLFGSMKVDTLKQGLEAIGIILVSFAALGALLGYTGGALALIGAAAALVLMSVALVGLAGAIKLFAKMDTSDTFEGIGKIFVALVALGAGLMAMATAIPGAAAVIVAAVALTMLAGALKVFSKLDWSTVFKALAVLAVAVVSLSVLAVAAPLIAALGAAILILGAGMALAGVGMFLFATGLATLAVSGAAGAIALAGIIITMAELLPLIMQQFGLGVIAFAEVITTAGPVLVAALGTLLDSISQAIVEHAPEMEVALGTLITLGLNVLEKAGPQFYDTGLKLLVGFLSAIAKNNDKIVAEAVHIVTTFIRALGKQSKPIAEAAFDMLIDFIDGLSDAIDEKSDELGEAGGRLAIAIIQGMVSAIESGASTVTNALVGMAEDGLKAVGDKLGINSPSKEYMKLFMSVGEGAALGVDKSAQMAVSSAEKMGLETLTVTQGIMNSMASLAAGEMDLSPSISPVLDLTQLAKDATKIGGYLSTTPVVPVTSTGQAVAVSSDIQASLGDEGPDDPASGGVNIKIEQTNNSPKALNAGDSYRNTKSAMALAKEALDI